MVQQSITELVSLDGRRALVTGAGSGIGRAAAVRLAQAGASVLALDVSKDGLAETASAASAAGADGIETVNLTGYFNVLKSTVARMNRPGSIIQIASIQGHVGVAFPAYTAAKGAILSLSRQLGAELGPEGIRVNSVSPGMILTGMTRDSLVGDGAQDAVAGRTPLRRVGNAEDIATAILYLASDFSSFVTSTDLLVDGGLISSLPF